MQAASEMSRFTKGSIHIPSSSQKFLPETFGLVMATCLETLEGKTWKCTR